MSDMQNARARDEALKTSSRASSSANRQRLWAGMNRYVAAEAEREHRLSEQERQDMQDEATKPDPDPDPDSDPDPA